jgi:hypothetical protein
MFNSKTRSESELKTKSKPNVKDLVGVKFKVKDEV